MPTPALLHSPVRSAADLTRRWADVLEPPLFEVRALWLAWLDGEGTMLPIVVPVDDLADLPDPLTVRGVLHLHGAVSDQTGLADGHLALALCRPGPAAITAEDDEWASALGEVLDDELPGAWSLHVAAAGRVLPLVERPATRWT